MNKKSSNQTKSIYDQKTPKIENPKNNSLMYSTSLHSSNSGKCNELHRYRTPNISFNLANLSLEDHDKTLTIDTSTRKSRYFWKHFPCASPISDCTQRRDSQMEWHDHDDDHWRMVRYHFIESKHLQLSRKACLGKGEHHFTSLYRIYIDENGNKYSFF
ncbi:unnamed protein product [Schistosoma turkestanicum]|nr:unnamed protein product [Schistosoma turkestanicum]